jgi:hypothetical protein
MMQLVGIEELAKIVNLSKIQLAFLATEGILPHRMKDGMPLFDPVETNKHLKEWAENERRTP